MIEELHFMLWLKTVKAKANSVIQSLILVLTMPYFVILFYFKICL